MDDEKIPWQGENRRKSPRESDKFYQTIIGINVFGWVVFVVALIVFHYARPELISGVQAFWGVEGRDNWSYTLSFYLIALLLTCVGLSATVLLLKRRRNRRKKDYFGAGGFVLLFVAAASLLAIYWDMQ